MSTSAKTAIKPTLTPPARRRLADEQPLSVVGKGEDKAASPLESPQEAAKAAHLRYVTDTQPGIRREKADDGSFRYIGVDGEPVTDTRTLERIKALGVPPAYTDVWICPIPHGHLQATGAGTPKAASSTATMNAGGRCVMKQSTIVCSPSEKHFPKFEKESRKTWLGPE